jgi:hypothetical protein
VNPPNPRPAVANNRRHSLPRVNRPARRAPPARASSSWISRQPTKCEHCLNTFSNAFNLKQVTIATLFRDRF